MKTIKVGIAGLGRLGKVHANNIAFKIPNATLTAACSIVPAELEYAKNELGVTDLYTDYREMLEKADIDAVAIVTTSSEHCWQIEAALDAGKHVFTDKPLGVDLEQCKLAEAAVERHPDQVFFLGFMRRYDSSYAYAKKKIQEGAIGKPYMVKAIGIDPEALVEGSIKFAATSGGIFIDMAIHDIDLMRWFLEDEPTEVYALGATFKHPEFQAVGDDLARHERVVHAVVVHGDAVAHADGGDFKRDAAGHVDAGLDGLADFVQVVMAGDDVVARIDDGDKRAAHLLVGDSVSLEQAAMRGARGTHLDCIAAKLHVPCPPFGRHRP